MNQIKLKKRYSTIDRIYYSLIYKNKIIGKGWIRKRFSYIRKGMYLYIKPEYRKKGYGTIFYGLLVKEISKKEIPVIILKVNKDDQVSINFLNKQLDKYEDRFVFLNKKIFIDTLIVE